MSIIVLQGGVPAGSPTIEPELVTLSMCGKVYFLSSYT